MTLLRDPVTIENTLFTVLGELTVELAAELTGRHVGYLNNLTHPGRRETLSVRDLEILDLAYAKATGKGMPLFEALSRRLESAQADLFADARAIGETAGRLAKEGGEAAAALIEAALSNGNPDKLKAALRECEQSDAVNDHAIAQLRQALKRHEQQPP